MSDRKSQEQQILAALLNGQKLTQLDALYAYGTMRLGARIFSLRKQGYKIKSSMTRTPNNKYVALYQLEA